MGETRMILAAGPLGQSWGIVPHGENSSLHHIEISLCCVAVIAGVWEAGEIPARTRRCKGHVVAAGQSRVTVPETPGWEDRSTVRPEPEYRPARIADCFGDPSGFVLAKGNLALGRPGRVLRGGSMAGRGANPLWAFVTDSLRSSARPGVSPLPNPNVSRLSFREDFRDSSPHALLAAKQGCDSCGYRLFP